MKKIVCKFMLAVIIAVLFTVSICSCGATSQFSPSETFAEVSTVATTDNKEAKPTPPPRFVKIDSQILRDSSPHERLEIYVDTVTRVQYLYICSTDYGLKSGQGLGVSTTLLVDANGQPLLYEGESY